MLKQRKSYSADLNARVAIAAIKGQETINEIASLHEIHPNQVSLWKSLRIRSSKPGLTMENCSERRFGSKKASESASP